jgi:hypothetical protein
MKNLILMAAMIAMATTVNAQNKVSKWNITPRAGFTVSTLTNSDDCDSKVGFAGGVEAEYMTNNWLGISAGLIYTVQGAKCNIQISEGAEEQPTYLKLSDIKVNLNYLSLPVLANFHVFNGLTLKAGLQLDYLTSAKMKCKYDGYITYYPDPEKFYGPGEGTKVNVSGKDNESVKSQMHSGCISLPIGIAYEYKNIELDARYMLGLTNANNLSTDDNDACNSTFAITIGYKFRL